MILDFKISYKAIWGTVVILDLEFKIRMETTRVIYIEYIYSFFSNGNIDNNSFDFIDGPVH